MKYQSHDFNGNLSRAISAKDESGIRQILMNEIGELIIYHRGHILAALNQSGIKVDKKAGDDEIVKAVSQNLYTNQKFTQAVATLLAHFNPPSNKLGSDGHEGTHATTTGGIGAAEGTHATTTGGTGAAGGAVGTIAAAVGSIFNVIKGKQDQKAAAAANQQELAKALLNKPGKSNIGLILGITAGLAAVVALFYFMNKKQTAEMGTITGSPTV